MEGFGDVEGAEGKKKKKVKPGSFQGLGLSQLTYKAVMRLGYKMPTPIQRKTIPTILEGQDVVAMARTGSGKTAAFLIPIVERLKTHSVSVGVRAVVLSPTRELAMQTAKFARKFSRFTGLRTCLLVGGQSMEAQFEHLANNPDIIVATPGRLTHHMVEAELSLSRVEVLTMDEADRLFELGFADQLHKVLEAAPISRQCLLFSATLPSQLVSFSRAGLKNPVFVRLDVETTLSDQLELQFLYVRKDEKLAAAVSVLRRLSQKDKSTIVFVATKHHVEFFGELLSQLGLRAAVVYGSMDQEARQSQVAKFRRKDANILVTTDVAARGIDIPMLDHVLNFDFPPSAKLFVHRSGRTARAGRSGLSISLVTLEDLPYTVELMLFLGAKLSVVGAAQDEAEAGEAKKKALIGAVPALEHEVESLELIMAEEGTVIHGLKKSMMASYGLYNKSRPSASKESVARAKELLDACGGPARLQGLIHPAFRDEAGSKGRGVGSAGNDDSSLAYIQTLRGYRPKVEKVGNVISTTASRFMEQSKRDATVVALAKAEAENSLDQDSDNEAEEVGGGASASSSARGKKRRREDNKEIPQKKVVVDKGPRVSKRARKHVGSTGGPGDDFGDFDVKVDGVQLGERDSNSGGGKQREPKKQFYLSVERDAREEAKERGLDMESYQLDLMADEEGAIKSAQSVMRWDAKKKKYLPVMVAADGKVVKSSRKVNESGVKVKGDAEKSNLYQKWAKTSKLRIQKPGELEAAGTWGQSWQKKQEAKTVNFGDDGTVEEASEKGNKRKPVVPFHGQVEDKFLTNKQRRIMKRRQKSDRVISDGGQVPSELKTPAQIQKEKKAKERNKLKQNPHLRKAKRQQAKEQRIAAREEKQLKYGAKTRSKMLVFEPGRKWKQGKPRPKNGHAKGMIF